MLYTPAMSQKAPKGPADNTPEPSFDQRLARLEEIVAELEQGQVGLEDAIVRYREGTELVRRCRASLDEFQRQVEELTESTNTPYAADPDVERESR